MNSTAVNDYIKATSLKSDLDRTDLAKDKTGVFTGRYAINPVNNKRIPDLDCRLCSYRIWDRSNNGSSGT